MDGIQSSATASSSERLASGMTARHDIDFLYHFVHEHAGSRVSLPCNISPRRHHIRTGLSRPSWQYRKLLGFGGAFSLQTNVHGAADDVRPAVRFACSQRTLRTAPSVCERDLWNMGVLTPHDIFAHQLFLFSWWSQFARPGAAAQNGSAQLPGDAKRTLFAC